MRRMADALSEMGYYFARRIRWPMCDPVYPYKPFRLILINRSDLCLRATSREFGRDTR